jgi:hypothetical protein
LEIDTSRNLEALVSELFETTVNNFNVELRIECGIISGLIICSTTTYDGDSYKLIRTIKASSNVTVTSKFWKVAWSSCLTAPTTTSAIIATIAT